MARGWVWHPWCPAICWVKKVSTCSHRRIFKTYPTINGAFLTLTASFSYWCIQLSESVYRSYRACWPIGPVSLNPSNWNLFNDNIKCWNEPGVFVENSMTSNAEIIEVRNKKAEQFIRILWNVLCCYSNVNFADVFYTIDHDQIHILLSWVFHCFVTCIIYVKPPKWDSMQLSKW